MKNKFFLPLLSFLTFYMPVQAAISLDTAMNKKNIVPVAIIGAGPAGLCAAVYTARAKLPTYVFTGGNLGGHLNDIERIENWPAIARTTGERIVKRLKNQAVGFGVRIVHDSIDRVDFSTYPYQLTTSRGNTVNALSVIVATGFLQQKLDIKGVKEYWGNGIGVCTICDAPFAHGIDVVVIGDDDFAAERVIQLAAYANKVTMVTRKPALTVTAVVRDYLGELDNIEIKTRQEAVEIIGDDAKVTGVKLRNVDTGAQETLQAGSVYLNSAYKPNSNPFKGELALDKEGYIKLTDGHKTSVPGVFAAGAVANKPNKAGPCAGFGQAAGMQVINFMHKTLGFSPDIEHELQKQFFKPQTLRSLASIPQVTTFKQLKQAFKHKPITLLFAFASGCQFCKRMYPDIIALGQEYQDKVQLITLPANKSNELVEDLNFDSLPTTFIYSDGKLVKTLRGKTSKRAVRNALNALMQQKAVPQ